MDLGTSRQTAPAKTSNRKGKATGNRLRVEVKVSCDLMCVVSYSCKLTHVRYVTASEYYALEHVLHRCALRVNAVSAVDRGGSVRWAVVGLRAALHQPACPMLVRAVNT